MTYARKVGKHTYEDSDDEFEKEDDYEVQKLEAPTIKARVDNCSYSFVVLTEAGRTRLRRPGKNIIVVKLLWKKIGSIMGQGREYSNY